MKKADAISRLITLEGRCDALERQYRNQKIYEARAKLITEATINEMKSRVELLSADYGKLTDSIFKIRLELTRNNGDEDKLGKIESLIIELIKFQQESFRANKQSLTQYDNQTNERNGFDDAQDISAAARRLFEAAGLSDINGG